MESDSRARIPSAPRPSPLTGRVASCFLSHVRAPSSRPHGTLKCAVASVVGLDLPAVADEGLQPVGVLLRAVLPLVLKQNTSAGSHGLECCCRGDTFLSKRTGGAFLPARSVGVGTTLSWVSAVNVRKFFNVN